MHFLVILRILVQHFLQSKTKQLQIDVFELG